MKKFIPISGCLPVEGTQNLFTHNKFPGLLLKRVQSVAQAVACGGIAWSEDVEGSNVAIFGALGVDSRPYAFGGKTVRQCAVQNAANEQLTRLGAVSGYPANGVNKYSYDSFELLGVGEELSLDAYKGANIGSTTANTRVMGIVSDADFGFIRSGVAPVMNALEDAAWVHGYVGKMLNFGSLRHIVNREWRTKFDVPDKLLGVYENAIAWWNAEVADVEIKLPLLCTWTGLAAEQRILQYGFCDLALSGVTSATSHHVDLPPGPGEGYPPQVSYTCVNRMFAVPTDAHPDQFIAIAINKLKGDESIVRDVVGRMMIALTISPGDTFLRRPVLSGSGVTLQEGVMSMVNEDYSAFASRDGVRLAAGLANGPSETNTEQSLKTNPAINVLRAIERVEAERLVGAIPRIRSSLNRLNEKARELAS